MGEGYTVIIFLSKRFVRHQVHELEQDQRKASEGQQLRQRFDFPGPGTK